MHPRRRSIVAACSLLLAAGCGQSPPPTVPEVVAARIASLPVDAGDPAWDGAPVHRAELILQDLVEPRLLTASTPAVQVQALTDGTTVAFRLTWADATRDDLPGAARFSDACAVQLPRSYHGDAPAPQMGETGRPVEISYWRASWQATVDGRGDTIQDLYPNATVDHYPFQAASLEPGSEAAREAAARYAPARRLGNVMEGPRSQPVEDLEAEGPGTLRPAAATVSSGHGRRHQDGWQVVIARPLAADSLAEDRSIVAFAVWQGTADEVGSRKMRTGWIPLQLEAGP